MGLTLHLLHRDCSSLWDQMTKAEEERAECWSETFLIGLDFDWQFLWSCRNSHKVEPRKARLTGWWQKITHRYHGSAHTSMGHQTIRASHQRKSPRKKLRCSRSSSNGLRVRGWSFTWKLGSQPLRNQSLPISFFQHGAQFSCSLWLFGSNVGHPTRQLHWSALKPQD